MHTVAEQPNDIRDILQSSCNSCPGLSLIMARALNNIPFPTIDRPFGIEIWHFFDATYTKVMGFPPTKFVFVPGITPLSTLTACGTMLATYYVTIFAGREFMKKREPFKLNGLFMIHNLYLTVISGTLLALFVEQLIPTLWSNGIFYAICDHRGGWTAPLVTLYYVNLNQGSPTSHNSTNSDLAQLSD